MILTSFFILVLSFSIGSLPTAFLVLRRMQNKDIRNEGSGNMGAMNAFEVSRSKAIGIAVLLIDFAKGALAIWIVRTIFGLTMLNESLAVVGVIAGHNFSPWVGFKGGRGLASAAGASVLVNPALLLYWLAGWLIAFGLKRNIHIGNIAATIALPLLVVNLPTFTMNLNAVTVEKVTPILLTSLAITILILLRHIEPLKALLHIHSDHHAKKS